MRASDAAAELLKRRSIRRDFGVWCEHALAPLGQAPARHHRLLIGELEAVASGECDRLMVLMPPGSAKSTYGSILFPPWFFARRPRLNLIGVSHTADLAESFSGKVQAQIAEHAALLGYGLESENRKLWETTNGGAYRALGVGGAVTGFRADLIICDDVVKSQEEADSLKIRDKTWEFYTSDLYTRLKPGGSIVLVNTRWHPDDLAGRLLAEMKTGAGDKWRVVGLPALAEPGDPLGRGVGEALWPEWEGQAALERKRAVLGDRAFASLFQQQPRVKGGNLFKTERITALDALPVGATMVRAWDLAATEQIGSNNPDWTVGVKLARLPDERFVVADVVRLRGAPDDVEAAIVNAAKVDGRAVRVGLPQDAGQAGKAQAAYLVKKLAGFTVEVTPETGSKATRAAPVSSQVNVGNLLLLAAPWNRGFLDELGDFPSSAKDDQVDALSRAFGMLATPAGPSAAERFRAMI